MSYYCTKHASMELQLRQGHGFVKYEWKHLVTPVVVCYVEFTFT